MQKWVYRFGGGVADGDATMRNLLGGKGANLAEMSKLGLPVPPGFTVTTEVCTAFYSNNHTYPDELAQQVNDALDLVGQSTGKAFGDAKKPLLVSVRSGARASMPGMMDTVLNLGLNKDTVEGLAQLSNDERFAYDSYRRFIQMYSNVVLGLDHDRFEEIIDDYKDAHELTVDTDLTANDWKAVIEQFLSMVEEELGKPFPEDVYEQLWGAINAVFSSWMNQRAIVYRRLHDIPEAWGTAVTVQAMVFGNMGEDSATGVTFTRDPSTGEKRLYGEFLVNAQGEDVVAGIRTPQPLTVAAAGENDAHMSMERCMPDVFNELVAVFDRLEAHYRDMQDIEFTVEQGKLYILQTRSGKRTTKAAVRIATEMVTEGVLDKKEALLRVDPQGLDQLLHPMLDPNAPRKVLGTGLPASPGAASGHVVFTADEAEAKRAQGDRVILVRIETSPEDIHGMHAAEGILTTRGGMTSHAAVVARGMGRPCVSGAGSVSIDMQKRTMTASGHVVHEGDIITIDGSTGSIMLGEVPTIKPEMTEDFSKLMQWADETRRMRVRTNAETLQDAKTAREFGAEGIGLCRTEHMFFDEERIMVVREMILAEHEEGRRYALEKLLPYQREDFADLFRIMAGLPVTIRLLDPPLHEFLPHTEQEIQAVSRAIGVPESVLQRRVQELHEFNPMLGHRGCRLGITYPEIYEMQTRAIMEAACDVYSEGMDTTIPEIMIPLIGYGKELEMLREVVTSVAEEVLRERQVPMQYLIGTMIELPRAALTANEVARHADFFSFGTNDLTQTTLGISRDDASKFLGEYQGKKIIERDPFVTMDPEGVGRLVEMGTSLGRSTKQELKTGICGEHGGDPSSIHLCEGFGLDYVSCSPFRVPIARLAAAQAYIQAQENM
ncbi:MAG: pyruvate, phosphate dikinase [Alphaproteobacteria bacterium]|jgi:pyruvate,orthophosphate dikinase|nr:pyruvate, phosphate dikinase [Alphaproteobacteria bacterium]